MSLKNTLIHMGASAALGSADGRIVQTVADKTENLNATLVVQFVLGGLTSVALLLLRGYLNAKEEEPETSDTD